MTHDQEEELRPKECHLANRDEIMALLLAYNIRRIREALTPEYDSKGHIIDPKGIITSDKKLNQDEDIGSLRAMSGENLTIEPCEIYINGNHKHVSEDKACKDVMKDREWPVLNKFEKAKLLEYLDMISTINRYKLRDLDEDFKPDKNFVDYGWEYSGKNPVVMRLIRYGHEKRKRLHFFANGKDESGYAVWISDVKSSPAPEKPKRYAQEKLDTFNMRRDVALTAEQ